jgi:hypothetical protein
MSQRPSFRRKHIVARTQTPPPGPVAKRAAEPIDAVGERDVATHSNREVADLVIERRLEYCERLDPVIPLSLWAYLPQRRLDIE